MGGEGRHRRDAALFGELPVMPMVHGVGGHHGDAAVTVDDVVPAEEHLAMRSRMFDRREACREVRAILERLELRPSTSSNSGRRLEQFTRQKAIIVPTRGLALSEHRPPAIHYEAVSVDVRSSIAQ